jgi:hypothetical protein
MNNQPFDRTLLIPIGVGVFSVIGMCVILVAGRVTALRGSVQENPTATPFKYAMIGTEPILVTATNDGLEEPPTVTFAADFPTFAPPETPIVLATNTLASIVTLPTLASTNTPTRTPASGSTPPLGAGTFDDDYPSMVYNGNWTRQTSVSGAYQNTLHVSTALGNSIAFRFIGRELRVFFQAGPSLGVIRLNLDGSNYDMNEASSSTQTYEWVLPSVANATHNVTITHLSGGSINLDYVIIPEVPATPTNTATSASP